MLPRGVSVSLALLCCVATTTLAADSDDWERIAAETGEPGYAMRIVSVTQGSQAEALGLRVGDYVYQIGESAMRGFTSRMHRQDEVLFYCREGGSTSTAVVRAGRLGVIYEEAIRPQISYLREEIGTRDPRWDKAVVEALANMEPQPDLAETMWDQVKALSYPDDELDAFVRAYCGWRAGRDVPLRATFDKIVEEFVVMPRLYAALLEDMAYASGETEVLRQLHAMDPDSSQTPNAQIAAWETFDSSPLPARSTLDEAVARRGRDLRDEITAVENERINDPDAYLAHLRRLSRFAPEPGRFSSVRFRIPEEVRDFHYSVSFQCLVLEHHHAYASEVRISVVIDDEDGDAQEGNRGPDNRHRTRMAVQSHRALGAVVSASCSYGEQSRRIKRPDVDIPVLSHLPPGAAPPDPAEFRLDIIRLDREIAAYLDGTPYFRLPVDPAAPNSDFIFFTSGIEAKLTRFEIWSLATGAPQLTQLRQPTQATQATHATEAAQVPQQRIAESGPGFEIVKDLQRRFDASFRQVHQPITDLGQAYSKALKRLLESETAKGDLDAVMQVRREIEAFGDGAEYSALTFLARTTSHGPLEELRTKYLQERERLWNSDRQAREALIPYFQKVYSTAKEEQTRLGNVEAALALREALEALESDPRFEEPPRQGTFPAKLHLVAKGEVLLMHNGVPLPYENAAQDPAKFVDGTTGDLLVAPGDVILLRMRSRFLYRAFKVALEGTGGSIAVPVGLADVRHLGTSSDGEPPILEAEAVLKIAKRPEEGRPDDEMVAMWNEKPLSDQARESSEWAKCGEGQVWHDYAIVVREEMLQKLSSD